MMESRPWPEMRKRLCDSSYPEARLAPMHFSFGKKDPVKTAFGETMVAVCGAAA